MRRLILEVPVARAAIWSRRVGAFALAGVAMAIALSRAGAVEPAGALAVFGASLTLSCLAGLLASAAAIEIWRTGARGARPAAVGFALMLALCAYPAYLTSLALRHPALNDVSTDLEHPIAYMTSLRAREARAGRTPPTVGADAAEAQRSAYPDLRPALVDMEPAQAYQLVLRLAKASGWRIVDGNPPSASGDGVARVDATEHSLFFGFADDIAIRITPLAAQTRIDMRSSSRVWRHDFGANASRVERFMAEIRDASGPT